MIGCVAALPVGTALTGAWRGGEPPGAAAARAAMPDPTPEQLDAILADFDAEAQRQIGPCSKAFNTALMAQLVDRGLIAWTDSNAALLDLMDEADGAYDRYRGTPPEAS